MCAVEILGNQIVDEPTTKTMAEIASDIYGYESIHDNSSRSTSFNQLS